MILCSNPWKSNTSIKIWKEAHELSSLGNIFCLCGNLVTLRQIHDKFDILNSNLDLVNQNRSSRAKNPDKFNKYEKSFLHSKHEKHYTGIKCNKRGNTLHTTSKLSIHQIEKGNMSVWNVVKPSSKSLSSLYTREHIQERSRINALNVVKPSAGRQSLVYICKLNEE